jgi:RNA polymerase sigma-70 factor (ECF subfamily)
VSEADDDCALVERIRNDEPGAFDEFVDRFGERIFGFGMRICGEREDARDIFQETLLQAFRSLKDLKDPRALRSWLYRVTANACLMKRRKGKFEPRRELSLEELMPGDHGRAAFEIPDTSHDPEDLLARRELREDVRRAIDDLPPHYRVVLILRDMEQLSTRETGRVLELPESTVKMRLHRARLMVRKELTSFAAVAATDEGDGS